ncbi:MAG TPA: aspartate aminotransferase family protein [Vicinamibacteria bacterium]|nr:aspartate aminotransferase family protein [Vicinamibacteria bacterium]
MAHRYPESKVFHRPLGRALPAIARGEGALLWDTEGRRYIDGSGGAVVVNVGHGRREIAAAMARQAEAAAYVHGTQFTSEVLEEYARRLAPHVPIDGARLYLVSGGSEANETAVKMARAYQLAIGQASRHKVIRRSISYHGGTLATLSLSGRPNLQAPYRPMLQAAPESPAPFCYHCPLAKTYPDCGVACADELDAVIRREGPEAVAAFIAEPVLGASAGAAVPPDEYARMAREICDRHGVLYVDDEVMTGFGRTGTWFGIEPSGVRPDLITCGKGMSGSYMPVGAVLASDRIVAALHRSGGFTHGFTFSHNPVTAAACLATLEILEAEGLVERSRVMGEKALARLRVLERHPHVGDVRGRGLMLGLELVEDKETRRPFARGERKAEALAARSFEHGLVVYPGTGCATGTEGDLVMVAPPLVISEEQLEEVAAVLDRSLTELAL